MRKILFEILHLFDFERSANCSLENLLLIAEFFQCLEWIQKRLSLFFVAAEKNMKVSFEG